MSFLKEFFSTLKGSLTFDINLITRDGNEDGCDDDLPAAPAQCLTGCWRAGEVELSYRAVIKLVSRYQQELLQFSPGEARGRLVMISEAVCSPLAAATIRNAVS